MLEKEKLNILNNIGKEIEIHDLLKDLLPLMGYSNVLVTHESGNVPEYGKDLIGSQEDEIEKTLQWTAFVVKKGDITGTSKMNVEIQAQIKEAFDYPYDSLKHGKVRISKVKIVTNGKVNSGAKQKFYKDEFYASPNISFWDADTLVGYIDAYYPRFWLKGSKSYKHYIELFQAKNKQDDFSKTLSINDKKIEKFVENAIKQKLVEFYYDETATQFKRRLFDVEDLNRVHECKMIVGESGSGKTTLFKQIASNIIYENSIRNDYEYYPIILKFEQVKDCGFDLKKTIIEYFDSDTFKPLLIDVNQLFEKRNFILFVDALDEIGSKESKDAALSCIKEFHKVYPEVRIICSSRNSDSLIGTCREIGFRYFEISGISIQQAETFIGRYFDAEQIKSQRLIKSLKDSGILDKLPRTPLTLTLLTTLFDENGYEIPATIADLYKYFVEVLLSKNIKESHLDLLKVGVHRSVLSFIAEHLHSNRQKSISKDDLYAEIKKFADKRGHKYNIEELINDLIQHINILVENDRGEIEFKHLSFQEYFTAYQYYNHNSDGKSKFISKFNDVWWQNVAIFYAGMTKDSPELLKEIIDSSKPKEFHEYLINVSGLGYLIQALYNTPLEDRADAIIRNIESTNTALKFIIKTEEEKYKEVKTFIHTTYGAYRVLAFWYEHHHCSVTLKEPLEKMYDLYIQKLEAKEFENDDDRQQLEYSTYLLASVLLEVDYDEFERYSKLLGLVDKTNYFVQGLIDADFQGKFKSIDKDNKKRKKIKKFQQRLNFLDNSKIVENVNISITDGKLIRQNKPKK